MVRPGQAAHPVRGRGEGVIGKFLCLVGIHLRPDGLNMKWTISWLCQRDDCDFIGQGDLARRRR